MPGDKQLQFRSVLLANYVTAGAFGKHTVVDIYSGDIIVAALPASVQIALYAELLPKDDTPQEIQLTIRFSGEDKANVSFTMDPYEDQSVAVLLMQGLMAKFEKEGALEIVASAEGHAPATIVSKNVVLGEFSPTSVLKPRS